MTSGVQIKRAYAPQADDDGMRILVDRLWPRGLSKVDAHVDVWLRDVAPSTELRRWFHHDAGLFSEFASRYRAELDAAPAVVATLAGYAKAGRVTLLYGARDERHNHALVLADYLRGRAAG